MFSNLISIHGVIFICASVKYTDDRLPQGKGVRNSPSLLVKAKPKKQAYSYIRSVWTTCMSTRQRFGFGSTKTMNNASVKRVSATCWAPGRSREWCVSLACCCRGARRWAIAWPHPQGRRCCSSPSPSSSSPSPPPLRPPSSTDGPGWCKTQKETKPRAQKNKCTHAKTNPNYISSLLEIKIVL